MELRRVVATIGRSLGPNAEAALQVLRVTVIDGDLCLGLELFTRLRVDIVNTYKCLSAGERINTGYVFT